MNAKQRRPLLAAASVIGVLLSTACSSVPAGSPAPTSSVLPADQRIDAVHPEDPEGRVIGTGTVIDVDGAVQLCLGPIMESYPPQCSGIPVDGWTWVDVDGSETSGGTVWGSYAVYGTYDGDRYTITDPPIMLALFDPVRPEDPTGGVDGTTPDADLTAIQDDLTDRLGADALSTWTERGYVWVQVIWDDGTLQSAADAEFGDGVVIVTSALREID
jgi:hypothetical protein